MLGPNVTADEILVLDNLGAHHTSRIKEVAAMDGARVIWLDPYSPDLSLIELMHSKIKSEM